MTATLPDCELVSAYAAHGSESAFHALVQRYVDLVFATALRHTGNVAMAQDVTQNVFISLARKAPRLARVETLAGWLHRAAVLETRACIRLEARRRRREQTASEIVHFQNEGASPFAALLPLLDEALLNLRETDRLAVVLRFLNDRSLREVATTLGVEEEAARKRISRALERLGEFFRKRGFATATAGMPAVLAAAAHAAPPALASACVKAGLSAVGGGGVVNTILLHLAHLSKTQTAMACLLLMSIPPAWQHLTQAALAREQAAGDAWAAEAGLQTERMEAEIPRIRQAAARDRAESADVMVELQQVRAQLTGTAARPRYHWDDGSPYLRLSKSALHGGPGGLQAVETRHGRLSGQIKEALQMNDGEAAQTENAVKQFLSAYNTLEAGKLRQVSPEPDDLQGHTAEQTRVFEAPFIGTNQMKQLRQELFGQVTAILGDDRAGVFTNALRSWMPVSEDWGGGSALTAVFNSDIRARYYQPEAGAKELRMSFSGKNGLLFSAITPTNDVPEFFQRYLQDWLDTTRHRSP